MNADTGLPTQAVLLPQPSLALSDPYTYLAQANLHRFFRCPRTRRRVTYADVGDENGPVVVSFLPSFCSRYNGIMADGLAREIGVRVLAIDRPGSGGTERCDLNERVAITCDMTESLLNHLHIREVMLLGCSAGIIHLLEYVRLHPERLSKSHPTISLVSPWIPGNTYLPWLPPSLVANAHRVVPVINTTIASSGDWFSSLSSWASSLPSSGWPSSQPPHNPTDEHRTGHELAEPTASGKLTNFGPRFMSAETTKLMRTYIFAESQQGMSQEYLLCLGKGISGTGVAKISTQEWFAATIAALQAHFAPGAGDDQKLEVKVWWGEGDGMVPQKAQDVLNGLFERSPGVRFTRHTLKDADHEEPMLSMEGLGEALKFLKQRAEM